MALTTAQRLTALEAAVTHIQASVDQLLSMVVIQGPPGPQGIPGAGGGSVLLDIVPTTSLPPPGPTQDRKFMIEDLGNGHFNLIIFAGGLLKRIAIGDFDDP